MNADQSRLAEAGGEGSAPCGAAEAALKGERKRGGAHALPCSHACTHPPYTRARMHTRTQDRAPGLASGRWSGRWGGASQC